MYLFTVRGLCEKERWGTSDAPPTIHQRHTLNFHGCMIIITLASTLIVLLNEFDILKNLHLIDPDDDTPTSHPKNSSGYSNNLDEDRVSFNSKESNASSFSRKMLHRFNANSQQKRHLSSLALRTAAKCDHPLDGNSAFSLLSN